MARLATQVDPMRAGFLRRRRERLWLLLTRLDGALDVQEDYAPWDDVAELRNGHMNWSQRDDGDLDHEVRWLTGDEGDRAWLRYGIVDEVGHLRGQGSRLGAAPWLRSNGGSRP